MLSGREGCLSSEEDMVLSSGTYVHPPAVRQSEGHAGQPRRLCCSRADNHKATVGSDVPPWGPHASTN